MILVNRPKTSGSLKIYDDPDDGPYLFLELIDNVESVRKSGYVTFKVDDQGNISHE